MASLRPFFKVHCDLLIIVVSVVIVIVAVLLIFVQVRRGREALRVSAPQQEIEKQIQEIRKNPNIPEHAKQQIIYQLRMRQGATQQMGPQSPSR